MRNFFSILTVCFLSFALFATDLQAKRFGGGKSFGVSRQTSYFSRSNVGSKPAQATSAAAAKPSTGSKWLGPLAGLAMGGLLASLFMGHGLGAGILSWLAIGGLLFLVWAFIRRRLQPTVRTNQNMSYQSLAQDAQELPRHASASFVNTSANSDERVTNFDETSFLRNAKSAFIRLQAAYDSSNLSDMREFVSPEVFAEIQLQLQERGDASNQTDVISIEAELLDLSTESHMMIASVMFSGLIREQQEAEPTQVKEIWHFHKFDVKPNWLVAGIQQA